MINILKTRELAHNFGDVEAITNPGSYHEFQTHEEAEAWGIKKYSDWARIHKEIFNGTSKYDKDSILRISDPVDAYLGYDFKRINSYLRGDDVFTTDSTDKNFISTQECALISRIENLILAIHSAPVLDKKIILYRQVPEETIHNILSTPSYCERGFMSTSLVKTSCVENCGNSPYLLKIYVENRVPIHAIYANVIRYRDENELLLQPDLSIRMAGYPYKDAESGKEIYEVKVFNMNI